LDGDELRAAVALAERAGSEQTHEKWAIPYFAFARGMASYREGKFDDAIKLMRGDASRVLGPAPGLVLAMSLQRSGHPDEAREALAAAVLEYDWRAAQTHDPGSWTFHVLRREAERDSLPNLDEFLAGKYEPQDASERLALLGICQDQAR